MLPRTNSSTLQEKIDSVNLKLADVCKEIPCKFINQDCHFNMLDGSRNDALYTGDDKHLNTGGKRKLLSNLGLVFQKRSYANVTAQNVKSSGNVRNEAKAYNRNDWQTVYNHKTRLSQNEVRCHYCGIQGHLKKQCRHGDYVRCFQCRAQGHKAKFCPN